jgi:pimeloyl-ACP methyl ester carboxylesterase
MSKLFLIPGLGADCRIYKHINLQGHEVININWIQPESTDTLTTYAQKLIEQYDIVENSVVIGNSMGGMIAVEIGKIVPLKKIILISSIRTADEASWYFIFFRMVPVYKIIPGKILTSLDFLMEIIFGEMAEDDKGLFMDMLKSTTPAFLKWSMHAILHWRNQAELKNVTQIAGDKDLVFNYRKQTQAIIIKGGTHIMIFDKAPEINKILQKVLSE